MRTPEDTETDPDGLIRLGTIATVDLDAARCTVQLDDQAETPPLKWLEWGAGALRTWLPPVAGEQVLLLCPAGEIGAAVVLRGLACDAFPPPASDQRGHMLFSDGARITYDPLGHELRFQLPAGASLVIDAPAGVEINGDLAVTGEITATEDVSAGSISLKDHRHGGVQAGGAQTGAAT